MNITDSFSYGSFYLICRTKCFLKMKSHTIQVYRRKNIVLSLKARMSYGFLETSTITHMQTYVPKLLYFKMLINNHSGSSLEKVLLILSAEYMTEFLYMRRNLLTYV
jgi:hypothetical protein